MCTVPCSPALPAVHLVVAFHRIVGHRQPNHRVWRVFMLTALGVHASAGAQSPHQPTRAARTVIESCVSRGDTLTFRQGVSGVLLDEGDSATVASAIVKAYPLIERDGLTPKQVALWRRSSGDWVYATLMPAAKPPHGPCFTATVNAAGVVLTPALLKKYFGTELPPN